MENFLRMNDYEYVKLNTSIQTGSNSNHLERDEKGNIQAKIELRFPENMFPSQKDGKKLDSLNMLTTKLRMSMENTPIAMLPFDSDLSRRKEGVIASNCKLDVYPWCLLDDDDLAPSTAEESAFPYYKKHYVTYNIYIGDNLVFTYTVNANTSGYEFPRSNLYYSLLEGNNVLLETQDHIMNLCLQSNHEDHEVLESNVLIRSIGSLEQVLQDALENAITYASYKDTNTVNVYLLPISQVEGQNPTPNTNITVYDPTVNEDVCFWKYTISHTDGELLLDHAIKPKVTISEQSLSISYDTVPFKQCVPILWNTPFVETWDRPEQMVKDKLRSEYWLQPPPKRVYKYGVNAGENSYNFNLISPLTCAPMNIICNKDMYDTFSFLPWIHVDPKKISVFKDVTTPTMLHVEDKVEEISRTTSSLEIVNISINGESPYIPYIVGLRMVDKTDSAPNYTLSYNYRIKPYHVPDIDQIYSPENMPYRYYQWFDSGENILILTGNSQNTRSAITPYTKFTFTETLPSSPPVVTERTVHVYNTSENLSIGTTTKSETSSTSTSTSEDAYSYTNGYDKILMFCTKTTGNIYFPNQTFTIGYKPTGEWRNWSDLSELGGIYTSEETYEKFKWLPPFDPTITYYETVYNTPGDSSSGIDYYNVHLVYNYDHYNIYSQNNLMPIGTFCGLNETTSTISTTFGAQINVVTEYHTTTISRELETVTPLDNPYTIPANPDKIPNIPLDEAQGFYILDGTSAMVEIGSQEVIKDQETMFTITKTVENTSHRQAYNTKEWKYTNLDSNNNPVNLVFNSYLWRGSSNPPITPSAEEHYFVVKYRSDDLTHVEILQGEMIGSQTSEISPEKISDTTGEWSTESVIEPFTETTHSNDATLSVGETVSTETYTTETFHTLNVVSTGKQVKFYLKSSSARFPSWYDGVEYANGITVTGDPVLSQLRCRPSDSAYLTTYVEEGPEGTSYETYYDFYYPLFIDEENNVMNIQVEESTIADIGYVVDEFTDTTTITVEEDDTSYKGNIRLTFTWTNLPMVVMSPIQSIVLTLQGVNVNNEILPINIAQRGSSSLTATIPVVENYYSMASTLRDLHDELVIVKDDFVDAAVYTLPVNVARERTLMLAANYILKDGTLRQIYIPPNGVFSLQLTFGLSYYFST